MKPAYGYVMMFFFVGYLASYVTSSATCAAFMLEPGVTSESPSCGNLRLSKTSSNSCKPS